MRNDTPASSFTLTVNNQRVSAQGIAPQTTLLDFLRDRGLTGAKEGCAEGECGACMVAMVEPREGGSAYRPVNSCLVFAPMAAGREVITAEGLRENGALSDAQQKLALAGGSQCGYCTPGFAVSLFAEQYRPDRSGPCEVHALGGNLCRCTGYRPIRDAALAVGPAPEGPLRERLSSPAAPLTVVDFKSNGSRFQRPATLAACLAIAAQDPEVRWVAGGTDMAVESNLKHREWRHLVSLEAVAELCEFSETPEQIRIGAGLPLAEIERQWTGAPAAFREWFDRFASPSIRNRATLGGNFATASPIGDSAPLFLALHAAVAVAGPRRSDSIPLSSFFEDYRKTALGPGELVIAVEIAKPLPAFTRFYKVSKRRLDDISTVAAGFSLDWGNGGRITRAVFAFGGVAATPMRAYEAEAEAIGQPWNEATVQRVARALSRTLTPMTDHRGSAAYRAEVAQSLVEKFWWDWKEGAQ